MNGTIDSWMDRNHFLLRRVHSLLGIIPVGLFLIEHLLTNSLAWFGPEKFNEQVHWLHNLHYLIVLEFIFIFLPLAFHGVYGFLVVWQAKYNPHLYPYLDNWRFALQRLTGVIAALFIIAHLCHFRFAHLFPGGEMYPGAPDPFALTQRGFYVIPPGILWFPIYAIGLIAAVYHFANGICTFCITWGITVSVASRKRMSALAGGLGIILLIWGFMSLAAFRFHQYPPDRHGQEPVHASAVAVQHQLELSNKGH